MVQLASHLFSHWLEQLIGVNTLLVASVFVLAFWFLDYAILEMSRGRKGYAAVCGLVGIAICAAAVWLAPEVHFITLIVTVTFLYLPWRFMRSQSRRSPQ